MIRSQSIVESVGASATFTNVRSQSIVESVGASAIFDNIRVQWIVYVMVKPGSGVLRLDHGGLRTASDPIRVSNKGD